MNIHLKGWLDKNDDGVLLRDSFEVLGVEIADLIEGSDTEHSIEIPEVQFRFYVSDSEKTLDEVQEGYLVQCIGGKMELETDWYGYSEYTIEGYSTEKFMIGNHDIESILRQYVGKYVHILIDFKGQENA